MSFPNILRRRPKTVQFAGGPVELAASAGDGQRVREFSGVAYTGGAMRPSGFGTDVYVDLTGAKAAPGSRPILRDHDPGRVVGHAESIEIGSSVIAVEGRVSGSNDATAEILASADRGFPWRMSIGASIERIEHVQAGRHATANGRKVTGPAAIIRACTIYEVSFVSLAGDDATSAVIHAQQDQDMSFDQWLAASGWDASSLSDTQTQQLHATYQREQQHTPTAGPLESSGGSAADDEATRQLQVEGICAAFDYPTIQIQGQPVPLHEHAMRANLTPTQVQLLAVRASRPSAVPSIHAGRHHGAGTNTRDLAVAGVLVAMGADGVAEKEFGERTAQQARDMRCRTVGDVAMRLCAHLGFGGVGVSASEAVTHLQAASSTYSIPATLSNAAEKMLERDYMERPPSYTQFAAIKTATNFKENTGIRVTDTGQFEEVGADGELKHGGIDEKTFTWSVDQYGKTTAMSRKDWIDDDLGALRTLIEAHGRAGRRAVNDLVWRVIYAAKAANWFSTVNLNYVEGAATALTIESLAAGIQALRERRDDEGNDLDIEPSLLVVGPKNEQNAKALLESDYIQSLAAGDSTAIEQRVTGNPLKETLRHVVEQRISNTNKFAGADPNNWFLFGRVSDLPMVVGFLDAVKTPRVKFYDVDHTPDKLAVQIKAYFDYGAAMADQKPTYMSKGKA
ncbi:phage major capsid protein [Crateriforma conspicua]|uniref:Mu-like prophage major head subunit gpT n=1 Tax=Crateriforma conspicua TaxID=2527996 RepID=A0A5C5Y0M8_9PLAN|nr:Mu-like prophage major head subunit gpT family protein [Crateriforma conspicua]TWT68399.1 Mu-like prophage major head subunit gpT [Crateriforma conspicua]